MGRGTRDAAYGMDAQGWHARAIEMLRPNMKKANSATSLRTGCALSQLQLVVLVCATTLEPSILRFSLGTDAG